MAASKLRHITLRLRHDGQSPVEFQMTAGGDLRAACHDAWRRYRARLAQLPGFFEARREIVSLERARAEKVAAVGASSPRERLRQQGYSDLQAALEWGRAILDARAEPLPVPRHQAHLLEPDSLVLEVGAKDLWGNCWLSPTGRGGVRISRDLRIAAVRPVSDWCALQLAVEECAAATHVQSWLRGLPGAQ